MVLEVSGVVVYACVRGDVRVQRISLRRRVCASEATPVLPCASTPLMCAASDSSSSIVREESAIAPASSLALHEQDHAAPAAAAASTLATTTVLPITDTRDEDEWPLEPPLQAPLADTQTGADKQHAGGDTLTHWVTLSKRELGWYRMLERALVRDVCVCVVKCGGDSSVVGHGNTTQVVRWCINTVSVERATAA
jgi:hypothetical protein